MTDRYIDSTMKVADTLDLYVLVQTGAEGFVCVSVGILNSSIRDTICLTREASAEVIRGLQMFLEAHGQPRQRDAFLPNFCPFCETRDGEKTKQPGWIGECLCRACGCTWRTESSWVRVVLTPPTLLRSQQSHEFQSRPSGQAALDAVSRAIGCPPREGEMTQKYLYFREDKRPQTPSKLVALTEAEFQLLAPHASLLKSWGGVDSKAPEAVALLGDCLTRPDLDELTVRETRRIAASAECLIVVPSPGRGDY